MNVTVNDFGNGDAKLCIRADIGTIRQAEGILRQHVPGELVRNIRTPEPTVLRLPSEYLDGPSVAPTANAAGGVAVLGLPSEYLTD